MKRSFALALLLVAAPAFGDSATEAKLRFENGRTLYTAGKVKEALSEFFVSNRLSPNPTVTFSIGRCLEQLRYFDDAFSAYSEYLTHDLAPDERARGQEALARVLPQVARLAVTTTPPGAAIFLDRENLGQYGVTPRVFGAPPGPHLLIVTLPGYQPETRRVQAVLGTEGEMSIVMQPLTGRVRVATTPPGASVVAISGSSTTTLGTAPVEAWIPIGPQRLRFSLEGYEPLEDEITVRDTASLTIERRLQPKPAPKGPLRVLTNVAAAVVIIDGREAGFTPFILDIPLGAHEITVTKTGYRPWSGPLVVEAAKPVSIEVTLEPKDQETGRGPWPWVLLSTSGVAGAIGAVLGVRAVVAKSDFADASTQATLDDVNRFNTAADVALGVALVGGVATAALFVFGEDTTEKSSSAVYAQ